MIGMSADTEPVRPDGETKGEAMKAGKISRRKKKRKKGMSKEIEKRKEKFGKEKLVGFLTRIV